jgi:proton-dependent oligopeptide transporter, POT family
MKNRTSFPPVFWAANSIEILERIAYYGIFMGFAMYMEHLGFSRGQLGRVQSLFLFVSYFIPVFSGTFADKFGFKKVLIAAYIAYIPSILLLLITKTFSGIALTMLSIGFAAGIFKPLISGTVRLTTDASNKTLGFGIFYMMVNIGGTVGPIMAAKLRVISWNYAFAMAALSIAVMFVVTILFYKEPEKEKSKESIGQKVIGIFSTVTDLRFASFLILLGLFFWWPFWAFFNICPIYIDKYIDTTTLFNGIEKLFGSWFAHILARNENGIWRVNGESIANTGWIILLFQVAISRLFEKRRAIPSFMVGLFIAAGGFSLIGFAMGSAPALVILGIFVFACGEMITSPRIQEYITWIAPKEKAGLYMGSNFLAVCIGAFLSGLYTIWLGKFETAGHPNYIWYILSGHLLFGILALFIFNKIAGEFKEMQV